MFDKQVYIERRKKLKNNISSGIILLLGNELSPINYSDNTYRFRQDSTFLYFFGINIPSLAAIIDVDTDQEIIFGNRQTIDSIVWTGKLTEVDEYALLCGVDNVMPLSDLTKVLNQTSSGRRLIHYLPPYRPENKIKLHHLLNLSIYNVEANYSIELVKSVVRLREIKSNEEIIEIEKAVNLSIDMHRAAIKMVAPGMLESEIAAEVNRIPFSIGCETAFPAIATVKGQILHNHSYNNVLKEGDLFLLDAGAELQSGYAGDLSSTFPVSKKFTLQQAEIYSLSLLVHETAKKMLSPNVSFKDVHIETCKTLVEGLKEIGLMKGDIDEAVQSGAHALFFPCGIGHMLGLDVHDMEDMGEEWVGYDGISKSNQFGLKSLRLGKQLKCGFVLTIEPGIYFIPHLIEKWESERICEKFLNYNEISKFRNFGGIRNEENLLITEKGARLLGKPFNKTIDEIEIMRT
ncbi:MAG: aminopeptidase P family protein [Prolixibacteraceae bacterium]|nr:aminopeptidase P family protein [Prolixibacteraceae bacterium]